MKGIEADVAFDRSLYGELSWRSFERPMSRGQKQQKSLHSSSLQVRPPEIGHSRNVNGKDKEGGSVGAGAKGEEVDSVVDVGKDGATGSGSGSCGSGGDDNDDDDVVFLGEIRAHERVPNPSQIINLNDDDEEK